MSRYKWNLKCKFGDTYVTVLFFDQILPRKHIFDVAKYDWMF